MAETESKVTFQERHSNAHHHHKDSKDHIHCSCHVPSRRGSSSRLNPLDDTRILEVMPLIPPEILMEDLPLTDVAFTTTNRARKDAAGIVNGQDDRLLVIVGPCSVHDPKAAIEYGALLKKAITDYENDLCIIMRVYFEKPRTTVGWKGLINDPFLDESFKINKGLRIARTLLSDLVSCLQCWVWIDLFLKERNGNPSRM
jgi:3-deoxy-7-phosphoheptulonate synthase